MMSYKSEKAGLILNRAISQAVLIMVHIDVILGHTLVSVDHRKLGMSGRHRMIIVQHVQ